MYVRAVCIWLKGNMYNFCSDCAKHSNEPKTVIDSCIDTHDYLVSFPWHKKSQNIVHICLFQPQCRPFLTIYVSLYLRDIRIATPISRNKESLAILSRPSGIAKQLISFPRGANSYGLFVCYRNFYTNKKSLIEPKLYQGRTI